MQPNEFWDRDDISRDQKFYTTFCMLSAACSDYAVGVALRRQDKLNWACTVLYYSLVHAARLICFVETGDFPTGHSDLSALFREGTVQGGRRQTWIGKNLQPHEQQVEPIRQFRLNAHLQENQQYWGRILTRARKLRDDANYEGLLISHEYSHLKVTQCLEKLAIALQKASERLLPNMVNVFKNFVDNSLRRDHWYAFLNWKSGHGSAWSVSPTVGEGLYYLEASLEHRRVYRNSMLTVLAWLNELRCDPDIDIDGAEEVHSHILMSAFAMKGRLMNDFERDIESFRQLLGNT